MDADRMAQRALDLHEKAGMPLAEALALAISEAAPDPIWPCAKLVIRNGIVCVSSHQYAPGLPDGEHDVYPLPVDARCVPDGVVALCVDPCPYLSWCDQEGYCADGCEVRQRINDARGVATPDGGQP